MAIHIDLHVKTARYAYLWLKYVRGFDASQHCARCLIGTYSKRIPYRRPLAGARFAGALDEVQPLSAPYLYMCGVTPRWAENLHVAFIRSPGSVVEVEDANIAVRITDACRILIDERAVPPGLPRAYATCRNFQFGCQAYGYTR
jgi:hypothetical protein